MSNSHFEGTRTPAPELHARVLELVEEHYAARWEEGKAERQMAKLRKMVSEEVSNIELAKRVLGCRETECEFCGARFLVGTGTGRRKTARFCKDLHRVYWHRKLAMEAAGAGDQEIARGAGADQGGDCPPVGGADMGGGRALEGARTPRQCGVLDHPGR